ncbi:hypothetical protein [Bradyrhizobium sp. sGM-13]|uniref:hypothetical protein n=1 Tax=Bradyrhizobium sp. sGM-13 TaxID=2831781 RepID=UPI001BD01ED7|nr:hypothetical protein [Bradyrhizobium sp. sGM-13]
MTKPTEQQEQKPQDQIEVHNSQIEDSQVQQQDLAPAPSGGEPPAPPPQEPKEESIQDGGRSAIAERFKKLRADKEPPVETTGDFIHPSQTYGQVAADQRQPEPPPAPEPQAPRKMKLKVRGEEREVERDEAVKMAKVVAGDEDVSNLSDEQLTRLAQIGAAGQSYLEETKQVLETTKRVQVSRQHPDAPQPAPLATEQDNPDSQQHPADPVAEIVEQLQYGDPKEVGPKLRSTIADIVTDAVKQVTVNDRVQQDVANDLLAHDDFVKKNAELAADPRATKFIRAELLDGYRDDLLKIGVPEEKIPTDPTHLANHHRHYKLQGHPVRTVSKLLEDAATSLREFRGTPRTEPSPQPKPEPRVDVNLNRDARRMAIPHQPTRANVQPALTQPTQQGPKSRHDAVRQAQIARGQAV